MEKKKTSKVILPLLVFIAFVAGSAWTYLVLNQLKDSSIMPTSSSTNVKISENSIANSVDKIYDATVVISTYKGNKAISTGTGFVYKQDGSTSYIITNYHVVSGGDSAKAIFSDGTIADTKILGGETYSDIAILTVSSSKVKQVASIGTAKDMKLGDTVFTVGAPLGDDYSGTVTKGILSGKDRLVEVSFSGTTSDYYMKVLQTDAALNPGNSGGPLCNINGEVIGVNSLKLTQEKTGNISSSTYSVEGMGFAIPIEDALYYAGIIEKGESVERPYVGISMLDITDKYYLIQAGIRVPNNINEGVAILEVVASSPAEKAKLQKGDIITKIGDEKVSSVAELRYELYKYKPGEKVVLTYNRNGKNNKTEVTLEKSK